MATPGKAPFSKSRPLSEAQATSPSEKPATGVDQTPALPPFPVLLQWLEFYHTHTGQWPEPESSADTAPTPAVAAKSFLTLLPDAGRNLKAISNNRPKKAAEINFALATGYNLHGSVYYHAALEVLQKYATLKPQTEELVLTFASFLAWCHYPPFVAKFQAEKAGPAMYLSQEQWSKVLKIRKSTLNQCLRELEEMGLVETGGSGAGAGDKTDGRSNRVYRLAVPLAERLPDFEPFQNDARTPKEKPEPEVMEFPELGTEDKPELAVMTHARNFKDLKNKKTKKHEHGISLAPGTDPERFEFLVGVASFPGYTSPEGLVTLDARQAQRFATDPALDLSAIKKIYHRVLAAWSLGRCTKNPIGFFHYSLTQHLKQATEKPSSIGPTGTRPGTASLKNNGSRFHKQTLHKNNRGGFNPLPLPYFPDVEASATAGEVEEAAFLDRGGEYPEVSPQFDEGSVSRKLQEYVLEALPNRFKQPDLAHTLSRLNWNISFAGKKIRLTFENPDSNSCLLAGLGQSEFSLLNIVVSQGLRSLMGRSFGIEIGLFQASGSTR